MFSISSGWLALGFHNFACVSLTATMRCEIFPALLTCPFGGRGESQLLRDAFASHGSAKLYCCGIHICNIHRNGCSSHPCPHPLHKPSRAEYCAVASSGRYHSACSESLPAQSRGSFCGGIPCKTFHRT